MLRGFFLENIQGVAKGPNNTPRVDKRHLESLGGCYRGLSGVGHDSWGSKAGLHRKGY